MQVDSETKNKSMEILSDVIFRGNINAKGTLSITSPKTDYQDRYHGTYIDASEFSFGGGKLYYGNFGSQQCHMVVASPGIGVCGIVITGDITLDSKTVRIIDKGIKDPSDENDEYYRFPNGNTEFFRNVGEKRLLVSNHLCQIIHEYDSMLMANTTLPANCTRFFFTHLKNTVSRNVSLSSNGNYPFTVPSIQVWRSPWANPRIVQMEVEMTKTGVDYNFIGNIADHQDEIDASEFILVVKK